MPWFPIVLPKTRHSCRLQITALIGVVVDLYPIMKLHDVVASELALPELSTLSGYQRQDTFL
jgi:hypothetical protein